MTRTATPRVRLARLSVGVFVVAGSVAVAASTRGATPQMHHGSKARIVAAPRYPIAPTTASNRRAAALDARRLLAYVVPPAGSGLRSSGTGSGSHVHLLIEAFASAVAYRTWVVAADPGSVLSFVQDHLPAGAKIVGTGSSSSDSLQSVTYSWPSVDGVLYLRWLEIQVSTRAGGGTRLYAESQSQWIVTRTRAEQIPRGVRDVDVTSAWPGKSPFVSRRVSNRAKVRALVALFDSLDVIQPGAGSCPGMALTPSVNVAFTVGSGQPLARATVTSTANFSLPAYVYAWGCYPVGFSIRGRAQSALAGNVIAPIQRLLHVKLVRHF
jgi:hypothetical protein